VDQCGNSDYPISAISLASNWSMYTIGLDDALYQETYKELVRLACRCGPASCARRARSGRDLWVGRSLSLAEIISLVYAAVVEIAEAISGILLNNRGLSSTCARR